MIFDLTELYHNLIGSHLQNSDTTYSSMKVLLINPGRFYYKYSKDIRLGLPLGIMYIASVLEQESVPVSIFDCLISGQTQIHETPEGTHHGVADKVICDIITKTAPDIVGITCPFTAQVDNLLHTAKIVKKLNPQIFIVAGGPHFSIANHNFLKHNLQIDGFISGEGEVAMLQLVKALQEKRSLETVKGLVFRTADSQGHLIVRANPPEFIDNPDWLPLPAYHLIDMNMFFKYQARGLIARPGEQTRAISMVTSRGCPFNCVFCSIHLHMGKKFRVHSADYVISHIKHVIKQYKVDHIFFEDDNLTLHPKRINRILELMIQERIQIGWNTPNGVRADTLNAKLLKIIKQTGCTDLTIGVESGDQDTLDKIIRKKLNLRDVVQAAKLCYKAKIDLSAFFVIGFPGETEKKIQRTINFAAMLYKKYKVQPLLMLATPLPGTKLYRDVIHDGYLASEITPKSLSCATSPFGKGLIATPEFSPSDLSHLAFQLQRKTRRIQLIKLMMNPTIYLKLIRALILQPKKVINAFNHYFA